MPKKPNSTCSHDGKPNKNVAETEFKKHSLLSRGEGKQLF